MRSKEDNRLANYWAKFFLSVLIIILNGHIPLTLFHHCPLVILSTCLFPLIIFYVMFQLNSGGPLRLSVYVSFLSFIYPLHALWTCGGHCDGV